MTSQRTTGRFRADQALAHHYQRHVMGSLVQLTVSGLTPIDRPAVAAAWQAASDEFDAVDRAMSRFRADSEVSLLNELAGTDSTVEVEPRLYRALATAHRAWRVTGGRFDPRVIGHLERLGYVGAPPGQPSRPRATHHATAGGDDAAEWLERCPEPQRVRLGEPIDLGGIGKGLALRWAWRRIETILPPDRRRGILLDAGGDLVAGGQAPQGGPWLIGIEDPWSGTDPVAVIRVKRGAVCTSSIRINRWTADDGRTVHHLIDPATGKPGGEGLVSVTVARSDPAWAEIWSKALFIAGSALIAGEARRHGLAAWWVDREGRVSMTPVARLMTAWP